MANELAAKHFVQIQELTAHNAVSAHEETVEVSTSPLTQSLEPFVGYTPFILFALLFFVAFGMLVVNRAKTLANMTTAFVLAFMAASIPSVLTYVGQGSRQEVRAGPEETPRNVQVLAGSTNSVIVSWETDAERSGLVRLGKAPFTIDSSRAYIANDQLKVRMHSVEIQGLKKNETYEFEILSGSTWYDNGGTYIQFTF